MLKTFSLVFRYKMSTLPQSPCLCIALRKATRVITRQYDEYLKPSGLRITQYSMLANISRNPGITISELAKLMIMDQTTVTRNVQLLIQQGYLSAREGDDRRVRSIHLSDLGKRTFEKAHPLWLKAQQKAERDLGKLGFDIFLQSLHTVVAP